MTPEWGAEGAPSQALWTEKNEPLTSDPVGMNRWNLTPTHGQFPRQPHLHSTETLQVWGTQGLAGVGAVSKGERAWPNKAKQLQLPPLCLSQSLALHPLPTRLA